MLNYPCDSHYTSTQFSSFFPFLQVARYKRLKERDIYKQHSEDNFRENSQEGTHCETAIQNLNIIEWEFWIIAASYKIISILFHIARVLKIKICSDKFYYFKDCNNNVRHSGWLQTQKLSRSPFFLSYLLIDVETTHFHVACRKAKLPESMSTKIFLKSFFYFLRTVVHSWHTLKPYWLIVNFQRPIIDWNLID